MCEVVQVDYPRLWRLTCPCVPAHHADNFDYAVQFLFGSARVLRMPPSVLLFCYFGSHEINPGLSLYFYPSGCAATRHRGTAHAGSLMTVSSLSGPLPSGARARPSRLLCRPREHAWCLQMFTNTCWHQVLVDAVLRTDERPHLRNHNTSCGVPSTSDTEQRSHRPMAPWCAQHSPPDQFECWCGSVGMDEPHLHASSTDIMWPSRA